MKCPKCLKENNRKDGTLRGLQRFLCKKCNYRYTVQKKSGTADKTTKRQALHLYLEGLGIRSIARIIGFSNVAVLKWIRMFGSQVSSIRNGQAADIVEIDEMHTYVKRKKATTGSGSLLIDMEKSFSILSLAADERKLVKNSGKT